MCEFKKGDKVRVKDTNRYMITNSDFHTEGIIQRYCDKCNQYIIKITKCDDIRYIDYELEYFDYDLELIDDENNDVDKENEDMNKVLELYVERHKNLIEKKYNNLVEHDFEELQFVKEYNELVSDFENKLEMLHNQNQINGSYVFERMAANNIYKYRFDEDNIKHSIMLDYFKDKLCEIESLDNLEKEVSALLSLSDSLDYQLSILERYDIIDKKTKKIN